MWGFQFFPIRLGELFRRKGAREKTDATFNGE